MICYKPIVEFFCPDFSLFSFQLPSASDPVWSGIFWSLMTIWIKWRKVASADLLFLMSNPDGRTKFLNSRSALEIHMVFSMQLNANTNANMRIRNRTEKTSYGMMFDASWGNVAFQGLLNTSSPFCHAHGPAYLLRLRNGPPRYRLNVTAAHHHEQSRFFMELGVKTLLLPPQNL